MKPATKADFNELYHEVLPSGWLLQRLANISNPRKWRWKAYLRACKAIPKSSPVHGSTNWNKINERRCHLIYNRTGRPQEEFLALQRVAGEVGSGPLVVQNFLMGRLLRRLETRNSKADTYAPARPTTHSAPPPSATPSNGSKTARPKSAKPTPSATVPSVP